MHGPDQDIYQDASVVWDKTKDLDPRIGMCLDIGHDTRNGKDPVADLKKYHSRVFDIHLKDVTGPSKLGYVITSYSIHYTKLYDHCSKPDDLKYVLENIASLVVKPVDEAGGYGISIGNRLTKEEIENVKKVILENPRKYIAQPIMSLSVHATYCEDSQSFEQRHVDLRTFALLGHEKSFVLKGGLTRVALKKGNLIVNSSSYNFV